MTLESPGQELADVTEDVIATPSARCVPTLLKYSPWDELFESAEHVLMQTPREG